MFHELGKLIFLGCIHETDDIVEINTEVTIKVKDKQQMVGEVKAILSNVIDNELTDAGLSMQVSKILEEESCKLAKKVQDLMEGEDHGNQNI